MRHLLVIVALICGVSVNAISLPDSTYSYKVEAATSMSSDGRTPFWLTNNRFGLSSIDSEFGYLRAGLFKKADYDKRFSWEAGVDLAVPYNFTSDFVVQQLYGGVRYRSLSLTVGSREWTTGVVNHDLSSGDLLFSRNARPVPQVLLEMRDFNYVPYTKNWLAVRGYFSMGMFSDWRWQRDYVNPQAQYTEKVLFHSKGLFLRVGDPKRHNVTVEGGLEMGSQFGGTTYIYNHRTGQRDAVKIPNGIDEIFKAIIPMGGGDENDPNLGGEVANCIGNHVGQWSLAATWKPLGADWSVRGYYEHFFEDHSMMFFDHLWRDMLIGVEVKLPKNPFVSEFVYEYLVTKDQAGSVYWDHTAEIPEQVSGRDDYYNNGIYVGWGHWGMGMGNPLLVSPIYNGDGTLGFKHNRIKAHHWGWKGSPHRDIDYKVMLSYTRSWGTYAKPTKNVMHGFSSLLEVTYHPHRWQGWAGRLSVAADGGRLLGKSFGAMLTISKSGWL